MPFQEVLRNDNFLGVISQTVNEWMLVLVNASHMIQTFCAQSWRVTTGCEKRCRWPHLVCCLWPGTWSCPWFPERSPDAARSGSDPGWHQLIRNKVRLIMIKHWIPLFHSFFSSFTFFSCHKVDVNTTSLGISLLQNVNIYSIFVK